MNVYCVWCWFIGLWLVFGCSLLLKGVVHYYNDLGIEFNFFTLAGCNLLLADIHGEELQKRFLAERCAGWSDYLGADTDYRYRFGHHEAGAVG